MQSPIDPNVGSSCPMMSPRVKSLRTGGARSFLRRRHGRLPPVCTDRHCGAVHKAMLIKLIKLVVISEHRDRFAEGQRKWEGLRQVAGFCGQTGGWRVDDPLQAVVLGIWRDCAAYDHFMADVHDDVFASSAQDGTYSSSEVTRWARVLDIPGDVQDLPLAVAGGAFLRIARCDLKPGRREHFIEAQQTIWNPGMAGAGGLLAGVFCESEESPNRLLVCTLWRSEADHTRYREGVFHDLRARAEVDLDCASVRGHLARIEPAWRVTPDR